jgi:hypothetical protein
VARSVIGFGQTPIMGRPALYVDTVPPPPEGRPGNGIAPDHGDNGIPLPHHRNEPPPIYSPPDPTTEVESWWDRQSTTTKVLIGMGAGFAGGLLLMSLMSGGSYQSNRRSRKGRRRASALKGKIRTVKGGRRFGHRAPPKRYWGMGARRKTDYGWPEGYKYPLVFRDSSGKVNLRRTKAHIGAAKRYFNRSKHQYPMEVRRTIARRINRASQRYGVGPTKVKV